MRHGANRAADVTRAAKGKRPAPQGRHERRAVARVRRARRWHGAQVAPGGTGAAHDGRRPDAAKHDPRPEARSARYEPQSGFREQGIALDARRDRRGRGAHGGMPLRPTPPGLSPHGERGALDRAVAQTTRLLCMDLICSSE